jgi:hypothetical protein|tara:strand:+ start:34 stop:279 length:246 start_codon:yes stop_codon:yes gene_type:complete
LAVVNLNKNNKNMSYLVGTFQRHHSELFNDDDPFYETKIVDNVDRSHLMSAKNDDDYQVINLITREYYNPKINKWVKIKWK